MWADKLRTTAIAVIAEYVGIAAEFIVDDALDDVTKNAAVAGKPDFEILFFFVSLGKHLPPEVPYAVVKTAITKALAIKT